MNRDTITINKQDRKSLEKLVEIVLTLQDVVSKQVEIIEKLQSNQFFEVVTGITQLISKR